MRHFPRSAADYKEARESVPAAYTPARRAAAIIDPTPLPTSPERNGGLVITSTSGSGKSDIFFVTPKFQFVANGLYEAPFGINVAANLLIRQGYGQPYYQEIEARARDPYALKDVLLVPDVGDNRLQAIESFDLRGGKAFRVNGITMNVDLDWFNVLNEATVLGRQYDPGTADGPGRNDQIRQLALDL